MTFTYIHTCMSASITFSFFLNSSKGLITVFSSVLSPSSGPCCVSIHAHLPCCLNSSPHPFGVCVFSKGDSFISAFSRRLFFFQFRKECRKKKVKDEIRSPDPSAPVSLTGSRRLIVEVACQSLGVK